jgi:hypothetical protein
MSVASVRTKCGIALAQVWRDPGAKQAAEKLGIGRKAYLRGFYETAVQVKVFFAFCFSLVGFWFFAICGASLLD